MSLRTQLHDWFRRYQVERLEAREQRLGGLPAVSRLSSTGRRELGVILNDARISPRRDYYLDKLELLLRTRDAPTQDIAAKQMQRLRAAAKRTAAAYARLPTTPATRLRAREEEVTS